MVRFLLVTLTLLTSASCYAVLGQEHTLAAAGRLEAGMSRRECLDALARGGAARVRAEWPASTPEERALVFEECGFDAETAARAIEAGESATGRFAAGALLVDRHWGLFGYGHFLLFVDADGRLVAERFQHVN